MAAAEPSFAAEVPGLRRRVVEQAAEFGELLRPRDPRWRDNTLLEVRAIRADEASELFAADLVCMYEGYARAHGWRTEVLTMTSGTWGSSRPAMLWIGGRGGTWPGFAFESGLHRARWQPFSAPGELPVNASADVLAYPESGGSGRVSLPEADIRVDTNCTRHNYLGGPGQQVYLTHLPTGITAVGESRLGRSSGKPSAMRVLAARLAAVAEGRASADDFSRMLIARRAPNPVRTYDLIAWQVTDHRRAITRSGPFEPGTLDAIVAELGRG